MTNQLHEQIKNTNEIFEKHNLANLAAKKPKLIEKRVNKATIDIFEQLEKETSDFRNKNS